MELVLLHSTVNIVRRMQQATTMLLVAAAFNIMLKAAFNIFVESSTNRMQHVAVLPQWNTALRACNPSIIHLTQIPDYETDVITHCRFCATHFINVVDSSCVVTKHPKVFPSDVMCK